MATNLTTETNNNNLYNSNTFSKIRKNNNSKNFIPNCLL